MSCGIYKITNQVNGKVYIGQSIDIEKRWEDHCLKTFRQNSEEYNYPLYQSIRKYGLENFKFEILEECSSKELNQKEIEYIALYESYPPDKGKGYNQTPGGQGGRPFKLQEEQIIFILKDLKESNLTIKEIADKFQMSIHAIYDFNKGVYYKDNGFQYPIRQKTKIKNTCPICGKEVSDNVPNRRCIECAGKFRTLHVPSKKDILKSFYELQNCQKVADKYNISDNLLNKWRDQLNIPRKRQDYIKLYEEEYLGIVKEEKSKRTYIKSKVAQISLETYEILNVFDNCNQAAKYLGFEKNEETSIYKGADLIRECCLGKVKKAYNYFWKFYEEDKL